MQQCHYTFKTTIQLKQKPKVIRTQTHTFLRIDLQAKMEQYIKTLTHTHTSRKMKHCE